MYWKLSSIHEPFKFIMRVKTTIDGEVQREVVTLNSTEKHSNNLEGQSSLLTHTNKMVKNRVNKAVPSTASMCICHSQPPHIWLFCTRNWVPSSLSLVQGVILLTRMPLSTCSGKQMLYSLSWSKTVIHFTQAQQKVDTRLDSYPHTQKQKTLASHYQTHWD